MNTARVCACAVAACMTAAASAQSTIGLVDFDGTELGLTGYANSVYTYTGAGLGTNAALVSQTASGNSAWVAGDAFWPMTRAAIGPNGIGMPFAISDDSVAAAAGNTIFASDTLGFAGQTFGNGFFGLTDTENPSNTGLITASFDFSIAGFTSLMVSADFAAMGDFEAADLFNFEYSIDGGAFQPLFTSSVDENGSQNYLMDSGSPVSLDDPVLINGVLLNDVYQNFAAPVSGSGTTLTIRFSAQTDGSEGFGFDNLKVTGIPAPGVSAALALGALLIARRRRSA